MCDCNGIYHRTKKALIDLKKRKQYAYNGMRALMKKEHEIDDSCRQYSVVFYSCADNQHYNAAYASKFFVSKALRETTLFEAQVK